MRAEALQNLQKEGAQLLEEIFQGGRRFRSSDIFAIDSLKNFPEETNKFFFETRASKGGAFHQIFPSSSNIEKFREYGLSIPSAVLRKDLDVGLDGLWGASITSTLNERKARACSDISMLSCPERPKLDVVADDGKGVAVLQRQAAIARYTLDNEKIKTYAAVECIVVAIWDSGSGTGALAHIDPNTDLKHAAIEFKNKFGKLELDLSNLEITIAGGQKWLNQLPEKFAKELADAGFKNLDFRLYSEATPLAIELDLKDGNLRRLHNDSLVIDEEAYLNNKNRILKKGADTKLMIIEP